MFAMLVCPNLHAQKLQVRVDSLSVSINRSNAKIENINESMDKLSKQVESLAYMVENLSYTVEAQKDIIGQEQSAIENSMGAVNILLAVFSLIITIGGIYLGWFINRKEKNVQALLNQVKTKKEEVEKLEKSTLKTKEEVEKLEESTLKTREEVKKLEESTSKTKDEVEKLEEKTSKTKDDIVELNNNINSGIEGLYEKLRREETITYLKRLVYEPNDIGNILPLLLSRELIDSDFKYALAAYRNLENKNDNGLKVEGLLVQRLSNKGQYLLLFYQHFCGQALCHELVAADIVAFFPYLLQCAFKNDVINSTISMVNCFNREDTTVDKVETVYLYLKSLHESKYTNLKEAYSVIVSKYRNGDELKDIWIHLEENHVYIKLFNELICEAYQEDETFVARVKAQKEDSVEENKNE